MIDQLMTNTIEAYTKIHNPVYITNENMEQVNFDGTQKPAEYFNAWNIVTENIPETDSISFLEIGAAKGLWAITFMELCKLANKHPVYATVTLMNDPNTTWNKSLDNVRKHYEGQCDWKLFDNNSQVESTRDLVTAYRKEFDWILIDADHSYVGVFKDIQLYAPLAKRLLMFHDIRPKDKDIKNCGIYQAIKDHGLTLDYEFVASEEIMGIGIIKK